MGDKVIAEKVVRTDVVKARRIDVVRLTWRDNENPSFDVVDRRSGDILTMDESFDSCPTEETVRDLVRAWAVCEGHHDDDYTLLSGAGIGEMTFCDGSCR